MNDDDKEELYSLIKNYFPDENLSKEAITEKVKQGDICISAEKILPYLQSALLGDKIIELEVDQTPNVFFTRMSSPATPPPEDLETEDEDSEDEKNGEDEENLDVTLAKYLEDFDHILTLPVEPGLGNLRVRKSSKVNIKFFTTLYAVELGTTFRSIVNHNDKSLLELSYPYISRVLRNARGFRAKVAEEMDLVVKTKKTRKVPSITCPILDLSAKGMGILLPRVCRKMFNVEDPMIIDIILDGDKLLTVHARVKHLSKLRSEKDVQFMCGILLDIAGNTQQKQIEDLLAKVQRVYLKSIAEKSQECGIEILA